MGRATALALIREGWRVALVGRRAEALAQTSELAGASDDRALVCPCDIGDPAAVEGIAKLVLSEFGKVDALVNAAGTNAPKRALSELSLENYRAMIDTNLHGPYFMAQAFLPGMRARGSGTIVNIVSDAGKQASPKAGPAYVMSKFGLAGLTQSINAEERSHGIRACAVFPGDIDTPLLEKRPSPPDLDARAKMLTAADIAECVLLCLRLPARAIVEELIIRPR